jgi:hypothetical protein
MSKIDRDKLPALLANVGLGNDEGSPHLFSYDLEQALAHHVGQQFYALIPALQNIAKTLEELGATDFASRIERNGSDCYVWLESATSEGDVTLGFATQNFSYLVYIVERFGDLAMHVRRIWDDYKGKELSGGYMLGEGDWNTLEEHSYEKVIQKGHYACEYYSDDMRDENNESLNDKHHYTKRPSYKTHQLGIKNHEGMKYLDSRDAGYVASITIDVITKTPCCDSPFAAIKGLVENIYLDLKTFADFPCLGE